MSYIPKTKVICFRKACVLPQLSRTLTFKNTYCKKRLFKEKFFMSMLKFYFYIIFKLHTKPLCNSVL